MKSYRECSQLKLYKVNKYCERVEVRGQHLFRGGHLQLRLLQPQCYRMGHFQAAAAAQRQHGRCGAGHSHPFACSSPGKRPTMPCCHAAVRQALCVASTCHCPHLNLYDCPHLNLYDCKPSWSALQARMLAGTRHDCFAVQFVKTFGNCAGKAIPSWLSCLTDPQSAMSTILPYESARRNLQFIDISRRRSESAMHTAEQSTVLRASEGSFQGRMGC